MTNHLNAFALLEGLELREDEEQQHESYNMTPLHVAVVEGNITDPRPGFGFSCDIFAAPGVINSDFIPYM